MNPTLKKILVVIDNILLLAEIQRIFNTKRNIEVEYRCSSNKSPLKKDPIYKHQIAVVNVKKDIDEIIQTYDLVISVHCQQFFPKKLVDNIRCINIHPGFNPINRGWYPQVFSIINDLPIGATIHEMDAQLDHGPIIARELVEKQEYDTSLSLYNKVLKIEIKLFERYLDAIINNTYERIIPENAGNMFRKADFNALCEINMNQRGNFREFYDLLRALSHGNYNNAFFLTNEGEKVFMSLNIEKEE